MANAAVTGGFDPGSIKLVAASKTKSAAEIQEAIAAGVDAVGENRQQEMSEKLALGAYVGAPLHFIGHLQSNKINKVVGICDLIESVSSASLLTQIGQRALSMGIIQDVLLECNIAGEDSKSGAHPHEIHELLILAAKTDGIMVRGLMAIPPLALKVGENRHYFARMYELYVDIKAKRYDNVGMDILSMGMSADFYEAILEGSNMVRIGTSLFGARN
jgi:pyridoxal phosphate enzyme (YggS family)